MSTAPKRIDLYVAPDGKNPFRDWLSSIKDRRTQAKIDARIGRMRVGNFGDCKSVGEGVSELRIDYGPGYRVYFGRLGAEVVLLLGGGFKDKQEENIRKARKCWEEFKSRPKEEKK